MKNKESEIKSNSTIDERTEVDLLHIIRVLLKQAEGKK
jgi:hypothetical protein